MSRSMKKSERLKEMERLYSLRPYSDKEMGDVFGIDRTLAYRDRRELMKPPNNLLIEKDAKSGGWKLDRMQYTSNVRLNRYEALVLYLATRRASQQGPFAGKHLANTLEKLSRNLQKPMTARLVQAADKVLQEQVDEERVKILERITQAWVEGLKLRIKYQSLHAKKPKDHTLRPYLIEPSPWSDSVYLIAYNDKHENTSVYKIERIVEAVVSGASFEIPDDFDEGEMLKHAWGIWARAGKPVHVKLRFAPGPATRRLRESVWHPLEKVTGAEDGGCFWEAPIAEWREMLPWVRGWGSECFVEFPKELKETLMGEAKAMAEKYGWVVSSQKSGKSSTLDDFYGD